MGQFTFLFETITRRGVAALESSSSSLVLVADQQSSSRTFYCIVITPGYTWLLA